MSMPDTRHQDIFLRVLSQPEGWRLWRQFRDTGEEIDLSGINLAGRDLRRFDLRGVNLRSAFLAGCRLEGSDLSETDLLFADLHGASLTAANLADANLAMSILRGADLSDARLHGAMFKGAILADANLLGADLTDADLTGSNLRGALLKFTRLSGASLRGANLAQADLTGAMLDSDALAQARNNRLVRTNRPRYQPLELAAYRRIQTDALVPRTHREEQTGPEPGATGPADLNTAAGCARVLGVPPDATLDEVVRAFRRQVKRCHPDMVRHLDAGQQAAAAEDFHRLHRAYEFFTRRTTRQIEEATIVWVAGIPRRATPHAYRCEEYEQLVAANPRNSDLQYNLAWKYFEAERHRDAIAGFQRVLELNPSDHDAAYNLAICRLCIELQNAAGVR